MAIDYTAHKVKTLAATLRGYNQLDILGDSLDMSFDEDGETQLRPFMGIDEDAVNIDDATAQTASTEVGDSSQCVLEQPIRKTYPIPSSQEEDLKFNQLDFYGEKIGRALQRGRTLRPMLLMAGSGATSVTGDFATRSTLRANTEAGIQQIAETFTGTAEVPDDDQWFGLLKSNCFYSMFGAQGIFARDSGGQGSIAESGANAGVKFCGFKIRSASRPFGINFTALPWTGRLLAKYQVDCSMLVGIFYHREAVRMRQTTRKPNMNIDWQGPAGIYQHLVSGRVRIGTKTQQLGGIVLLVSTV